MNRMIKYFCLIFFAFIVLTFIVVRQTPTEQLIVVATSPDAKPLARSAARGYLTHFGSLKTYGRGENLPPLQFVLGGCVDRLPADRACRDVFEWLLAQGEDINGADVTVEARSSNEAMSRVRDHREFNNGKRWS